jgi:hypothetical protein
MSASVARLRNASRGKSFAYSPAPARLALPRPSPEAYIRALYG